MSLSPEAPQNLGPVLGLLHAIVAAAEISASGDLRITFEAGATIVVRPDDDYEAWELLGPDGIQIVCMPGGELAIWGRAKSRF